MAELYSILLVDDTETNIDILVEILGDDYDLYVAMDGETALEIVDEERPDLVLLDIMMPGMDGYEVLSRIRQKESVRDTPVVFVSAKDESSDQSYGLGLGASAFITKPINPAEVRTVVQQILTGIESL